MPRTTSISRYFIHLCLAGVMYAGNGGHADAVDWPQHLGPDRNGVYSRIALADAWPKDGPPLVWKKSIGRGFSGPVCRDGKLVVFHRVQHEEIIDCFEADTGKPIWQFKYSTAYRDDFGFDDGPRATPSIADGGVYTFGAEGMLHRIDLITGRKTWAVNTRERFGARKGFFGLACSPLIEGNRVLVNVGGTNGAGIVAFDTATGQTVWTMTNDEASYSSPVGATFGNERVALFFTRAGLVVLRSHDGKPVWTMPWRSRMNASVNAATPLVIDDSIFLSASYGVGAILLNVSGSKLEKVWSSDDSLSNHYATSVHHQGFLYGFHGRQETGPSFRCVELRTGIVRWSEDQLPAGTVTLAGDQLLILLEDGRLLMGAADPARWRLMGEAQVLPFGVRAYPALAAGRLYARSRDTLVCLDLRSPEQTHIDVP